jgi:hypothetical protein
MKLIQGSLYGLISMARSIWIVSHRVQSTWALSERRLVQGSLLLLDISERFFTDTFVAFLIESVKYCLTLSIFHHLNNLDGEVVKLWLE